jgi:hypothetical protein
MKTAIWKNLLLGAWLMAGSAATLYAQQYSVGWSAVAAGGGTASTGGQYSLAATIGQSAAGGPATGGNYSPHAGFWQSAAGGSILTIRLTSPTTALVSWPAPAVGCFVLQQTSSLTSPNWVDVPNAVAFANGVNSVVLPATSLTQFYRLVSPCL